MKVYNMESPRTGREVANQFIIEDGQRTVFQSYNSTIAEIDRKNSVITIYPNWDYSMTTAKYRNAFFDGEGFSGLASKKGLHDAMKKGTYNGYKVVTC